MQFDDLPPFSDTPTDYSLRDNLPDLHKLIAKQSIPNSDVTQSASSLKLALQLSPVPAIFARTQDLQIDWANPSALDFLKVSGQTESRLQLADFIAERELPNFYETMAELQRGERQLATTTLSSDDGIGLCKVVLTQTDHFVLAVGRATTASFASHETIEQTDALTGLPDRRTLFSSLEQLLERKDREWGVLFIDLNHYKQVNDRYGHIAGDKVLVEFARKLRASSRPNDLVVRYGGDEFVILVDQVSSSERLRAIGERLAREVKVFVRGDSAEDVVAVTLTVGCATASCATAYCATVSSEWNSAEQVLNAADRDMYRQKRGR